MKKNVWKKLMAAILSACMVFGLSACGSSDDAQDASQSSGASGTLQETSGETTAGQEGEASGEQIEISVALWDYSITDYYKNVIAAFEEANPDITVNVIEISADEYNDVIQIMLSGGDDVDVVFTKEVQSLAGLISKEQVLPLDSYIEASQIDESYYGGMLGELSMNDSVYAMPFRKDCTILFYNKDLFDAAGVEYPHDGMTLAEYRELAAAMTSGEGSEKVYGAHLHTWPRSLQNFARKTDDFHIVEQPVSNLQEYYEIFLAMQNEDQSIMDYGTLNAGNIHYSGVFYNEQCAMVSMGTWFVNNLLEQEEAGNIDFEWGICSLPDMEGTGNQTGVIGVAPVSINAASEHPDEAWRFIEFVTGAEGAAVIAQSGIIPGYIDENVQNVISSLEGIPENFADYLNAENLYLEQPMHPNANELEQINTEEHSLIMSGEISIEEGLAEMQSRIDQVLGN